MQQFEDQHAYKLDLLAAPKDINGQLIAKP